MAHVAWCCHILDLTDQYCRGSKLRACRELGSRSSWNFSLVLEQLCWLAITWCVLLTNTDFPILTLFPVFYGLLTFVTFQCGLTLWLDFWYLVMSAHFQQSSLVSSSYILKNNKFSFPRKSLKFSQFSSSCQTTSCVLGPQKSIGSFTLCYSNKRWSGWGWLLCDTNQGHPH